MTDKKDRIDEVNDKINQVFVELGLLKSQIGRLEGIIESERGTLKRQGEYGAQALEKEKNNLTHQIDKIEKEFRSIIYDPKEGLLIKNDRLTIESQNRQNMKKNIWALWIAVGVQLVKTIFDLLKK
jgi:hypothetical protein